MEYVDKSYIYVLQDIKGPKIQMRKSFECVFDDGHRA